MAEQTQKQKIEERVRTVAEPIVAGEGMELVDLEFVREKEGFVLRLFIDKTGGIGLEDCSQASRAVETALDVEDLVPHEYNLEVSSPGLNRPLKKPQHYERVKGKTIIVKTYGPIGSPPRKNFKGICQEVSPEAVTVHVEGAGAFTIPFKEIAKANLEFEF